MEDRTVIRAEQVRFQYKKRDVDGNVIATEEILKGVDLTIKKGEFIALLGRNGSGKTTFSKQLNAILRPSEGTVTVDEMGTRDAEKLYEIRQRVGMVFQNPDNQMVAANVEKEVAFGPENLRQQLKTRLADFEIPKRVIVLEALPKNTSGKVDKARLRQWWLDSE